MKVRKKPIIVEAKICLKDTIISTLEGNMLAKAGDIIITGVKGEKYPIKREIFDETYEIINP